MQLASFAGSLTQALVTEVYALYNDGLAALLLKLA